MPRTKRDDDAARVEISAGALGAGPVTCKNRTEAFRAARCLHPVQTMLNVLQEKKSKACEPSGKGHFYSPAVTRSQVSSTRWRSNRSLFALRQKVVMSGSRPRH